MESKKFVGYIENCEGPYDSNEEAHLVLLKECVSVRLGFPEKSLDFLLGFVPLETDPKSDLHTVVVAFSDQDASFVPKTHVEC